jgi:hypothetical protein
VAGGDDDGADGNPCHLDIRVGLIVKVRAAMTGHHREINKIKKFQILLQCEADHHGRDAINPVFRVLCDVRWIW